METSKNNALTVVGVVAGADLGMSLVSFQNFIRQHELTIVEVGRVLDIRKTYHASVPYISKLLAKGHDLAYISASYQLRELVDPLYDPNLSRGEATSEFGISIEKSCELLNRMFPDQVELSEEELEAASQFLHAFAEYCPEARKTWSAFMTIVLDSWTAVEDACKGYAIEIFDYTPEEQVYVWLKCIRGPKNFF